MPTRLRRDRGVALPSSALGVCRRRAKSLSQGRLRPWLWICPLAQEGLGAGRENLLQLHEVLVLQSIVLHRTSQSRCQVIERFRRRLCRRSRR